MAEAVEAAEAVEPFKLPEKYDRRLYIMMKKVLLLTILAVFILLGSGCDQGNVVNEPAESNTTQSETNNAGKDKYALFVNAKWTTKQSETTHFNKHVADVAKGEKWNQLFGYSEKEFKQLLDTKEGRDTLLDKYNQWIKKTIETGEVFSYTYDGDERIGFYDGKNNIFVTTDPGGKKVYTCFRPDSGREYIENRDNYKKIKR